MHERPVHRRGRAVLTAVLCPFFVSFISKIDKNRPLYRHNANTEGDTFCFLRPGSFPLGFLAFHLGDDLGGLFVDGHRLCRR